MFSKQEVFNPTDTDYSAIPEEMYQKFQEQYDKNAIKRLEKRGFTIIPPVATAWYPPLIESSCESGSLLALWYYVGFFYVFLST